MKIGFLPFYIALYDEVAPQRRPQVESYVNAVADEYRKRRFEVVQAPVCRVKAEFAAALADFAAAGCEAILTLHAAYSPSLESAELLASCPLPLVVADTTRDEEFGFDFGDKVMLNHGIHGVQDMCNLLIRNKKTFLIDAGARQDSDFFDRSARSLRAACIARALRGARVGTVGGKFAGMGDFLFPEGAFGIQTVEYRDCGEAPESAVQAELAADADAFVIAGLPPEVHRRTTKAALRLRRWLDAEKLSAFTICFPGITRTQGWETVPFLECSKALARGVGYAGEGDVLTAALCGALLRVFPESSFTEMFCPDWKGNRIFLSHMGEINLALTERKPRLTEREYVFSPTGNPAVATGALKPGAATLVNLAPGPDGTFSLLTVPVEMLAPGTPSTATNTGWLRPLHGNIGELLEAYSRLGGTHHSVLIYGADAKVLAGFAALTGTPWHEL